MDPNALLPAACVLIAHLFATVRGDAQNSRGASVIGDPVLTGFDGQMFEFKGVPDHYYNLISEAEVFQVTTLLKPDTAAGHNGTYMKGIALLHKNGRVLIETGADYEDDIVVTLNGEVLEIESPETESTTRAVTLEDGSALNLHWQSYAPNAGPLVELRTVNLLLVVSLTSAAPDLQGNAQPSYLNANITVLREPHRDLEGILGETYSPGSHRSFPIYSDSHYEVDGYFGATLSQTMADLVQKFLRTGVNVAR